MSKTSKKIDRDFVLDNFGEDINVVRKGMSRSGSQFDDTHHPVPINKDLPISAGTGDRILQVAIGQYQKIYENPLQMAIALSHFEEWSKKTGWTPTYASIAYYLCISKGTLVKYTDDKTEYICYSILDTINNQYIYSTNDKKKLKLYIDRNNIVEDNNNSTIESKDNNNNNIINNTTNISSNGNDDNSIVNNTTDSIRENPTTNPQFQNCISMQQKIDSGEYKIVTSTTTFAATLEPINNWLEMINEEQAVNAKNPAWNIFKAVNRMGRTTQYVNKQDIIVTPKNPIDEMSDSDILKAAEERPTEE